MTEHEKIEAPAPPPKCAEQGPPRSNPSQVAAAVEAAYILEAVRK